MSMIKTGGGYRWLFENSEQNISGSLFSVKELLGGMISPRKIIHQTLVTTFGLQYNEYSGIFDHVITMDDLFK